MHGLLGRKGKVEIGFLGKPSATMSAFVLWPVSDDALNFSGIVIILCLTMYREKGKMVLRHTATPYKLDALRA
jgi:hypothetical protein